MIVKEPIQLYTNFRKFRAMYTLSLRSFAVILTILAYFLCGAPEFHVTL
jgi:hypothetical protein